MEEFNELNGAIFIPPKNRMSGKINIIGIGSCDLIGKLTVKQITDLISLVNIYTDEFILTPSLPPVMANQRKAKFLIPYREQISASVFIPPKNKMSGLVTGIEPPTYYLNLEPEADTFIRSQLPTLNYGDLQSVLVGYRKNNNEIFRTLIKFDENQIPVNSKIESAFLKLYNYANNNSTQQVGIYSISTNWQEYGVTWANQPAIKELVTIAETGNYGYTNIDITDIVTRWYDKSESNTGLMIRYMNERENQYEQYVARESISNKPHLELQYKLDVIYSVGRSNIDASVFVKSVGKSDLLECSITVPLYENSAKLSSNVHIYNFNWMLEASVNVNKPELISDVKIKRTDDEYLIGLTKIRVKGGHLPGDRLDARVTINKPIINAVVKLRLHNYLPSNININPRIIDADLIGANVKVVRRKSGYDLFPSFLIINNPRLTAKVIIKRQQEASITGELTIRRNERIKLKSNFVVNKPSLIANVKVVLSEYLDASVTIKQVSNITANVFIPYKKFLPASINIIHASMLKSSIFVISGYLKATITIPWKGTSYRQGKVFVRVREANEIIGVVNIGGDNILGGYVYLF